MPCRELGSDPPSLSPTPEPAYVEALLQFLSEENAFGESGWGKKGVSLLLWGQHPLQPGQGCLGGGMPVTLGDFSPSRAPGQEPGP